MLDKQVSTSCTNSLIKHHHFTRNRTKIPCKNSHFNCCSKDCMALVSRIRSSWRKHPKRKRSKRSILPQRDFVLGMLSHTAIQDWCRCLRPKPHRSRGGVARLCGGCGKRCSKSWLHRLSQLWCRCHLPVRSRILVQSCPYRDLCPFYKCSNCQRVIWDDRHAAYPDDMSCAPLVTTATDDHNYCLVMGPSSYAPDAVDTKHNLTSHGIYLFEKISTQACVDASHDASVFSAAHGDDISQENNHVPSSHSPAGSPRLVPSHAISITGSAKNMWCLKSGSLLSEPHVNREQVEVSCQGGTTVDRVHHVPKFIDVFSSTCPVQRSSPVSSKLSGFESAVQHNTCSPLKATVTSGVSMDCSMLKIFESTTAATASHLASHVARSTRLTNIGWRKTDVTNCGKCCGVTVPPPCYVVLDGICTSRNHPSQVSSVFNRQEHLHLLCSKGKIHDCPYSVRQGQCSQVVKSTHLSNLYLSPASEEHHPLYADRQHSVNRVRELIDTSHSPSSMMDVFGSHPGEDGCHTPNGMTCMPTTSVNTSRRSVYQCQESRSDMQVFNISSQLIASNRSTAYYVFECNGRAFISPFVTKNAENIDREDWQFIMGAIASCSSDTSTSARHLEFPACLKYKGEQEAVLMEPGFCRYVQHEQFPMRSVDGRTHSQQIAKYQGPPMRMTDAVVNAFPRHREERRVSSRNQQMSDDVLIEIDYDDDDDAVSVGDTNKMPIDLEAKCPSVNIDTSIGVSYRNEAAKAHQNKRCVSEIEAKLLVGNMCNLNTDGKQPITHMGCRSSFPVSQCCGIDVENYHGYYPQYSCCNAGNTDLIAGSTTSPSQCVADPSKVVDDVRQIAGCALHAIKQEPLDDDGYQSAVSPENEETAALVRPPTFGRPFLTDLIKVESHNAAPFLLPCEIGNPGEQDVVKIEPVSSVGWQVCTGDTSCSVTRDFCTDDGKQSRSADSRVPALFPCRLPGLHHSTGKLRESCDVQLCPHSTQSNLLDHAGMRDLPKSDLNAARDGLIANNCLTNFSDSTDVLASTGNNGIVRSGVIENTVGGTNDRLSSGTVAHWHCRETRLSDNHLDNNLAFDVFPNEWKERKSVDERNCFTQKGVCERHGIATPRTFSDHPIHSDAGSTRLRSTVVNWNRKLAANVISGNYDTKTTVGDCLMNQDAVCCMGENCTCTMRSASTTYNSNLVIPSTVPLMFPRPSTVERVTYDAIPCKESDVGLHQHPGPIIVSVRSLSEQDGSLHADCPDFSRFTHDGDGGGSSCQLDMGTEVIGASKDPAITVPKADFIHGSLDCRTQLELTKDESMMPQPTTSGSTTRPRPTTLQPRCGHRNIRSQDITGEQKLPRMSRKRRKKGGRFWYSRKSRRTKGSFYASDKCSGAPMGNRDKLKPSPASTVAHSNGIPVSRVITAVADARNGYAPMSVSPFRHHLSMLGGNIQSGTSGCERASYAGASYAKPMSMAKRSFLDSNLFENMEKVATEGVCSVESSLRMYGSCQPMCQQSASSVCVNAELSAACSRSRTVPCCTEFVSAVRSTTATSDSRDGVSVGMATAPVVDDSHGCSFPAVGAGCTNRCRSVGCVIKSALVNCDDISRQLKPVLEKVCRSAICASSSSRVTNVLPNRGETTCLQHHHPSRQNDSLVGLAASVGSTFSPVLLEKRSVFDCLPQHCVDAWKSDVG